jgi:hypothetical protein
LAAQTAVWTALASAPHISKHVIGLPPFPVQETRHSSSLMHVGSERHADAWAQQLVAMQSKHGVPSDGHMGGPQTPAEHAPLQHWDAVMHEVPSSWQALPHTPPLQSLLQQSLNATQGDPLGAHTGTPQSPFEHSPVQQSPASGHGSPSGVHTCMPQTPLEHSVQQVPPSLGHALPSGVHACPPQTPLKQSLLQQGAAGLHTFPSGKHTVRPQTPLLQSRLQQGVVALHALPSGTQRIGPQTPLLQSLLQQGGAPALHRLPSGVHTGGGPQTPAKHSPLQQSPPSMGHSSPFGVHSVVGPQMPLTLQSLLQQGAAGLHGIPSGVHIGGPQMLSKHSPLQQGPRGLLQGMPLGAHIVGPQMPLKHSPPQQVPPSTGHGSPGGVHVVDVPQRPPVHAPLQHCAALAHEDPSASQEQASLQIVETSLTQIVSQVLTQQKGSSAQMAATHGSQVVESSGPVVHSLCEQLLVWPQTPLAQAPLQQIEAASQGLPFGRQVCGPQRPLEQTPSQQDEPSMHGVPFGRHTSGPQIPSTAQIPAQHTASATHMDPLGTQAPQKPPEHCMVQHCAAELHAVWSGWQVAAQVPFWQAPEQHSTLPPQLPPGCWQVVAVVQTPAGPQSVEQHAADVEQAVPLGEHDEPPQTPPVQLPEQQSVSSSHAPPCAPHVVPPSAGRPASSSLRPQLIVRKGTQKKAAIATRSQA